MLIPRYTEIKTEYAWEVQGMHCRKPFNMPYLKCTFSHTIHADIITQRFSYQAAWTR